MTTEEFISFIVIFYVTAFMVWFSGLDLLSNLEQNQIKSGIGSCIAPTAGLALHPAGKYGAGILGFLDSEVSVSCCPGTKRSWGDPVAPPPSTEGESPSQSFYSVGGGGYFVDCELAQNHCNIHFGRQPPLPLILYDRLPFVYKAEFTKFHSIREAIKIKKRPSAAKLY